MELLQGTMVTFADSQGEDWLEPIGTVAGCYNSEIYPDIITVIVTDMFKRNRCGWFWDRFDNPLDPICRDKFVYNFPAYQLKSCMTKLGNVL